MCISWSFQGVRKNWQFRAFRVAAASAFAIPIHGQWAPTGANESDEGLIGAKT